MGINDVPLHILDFCVRRDSLPEEGVFGNENLPINVIHEEATEQRNLEGIRPYESGISLNNWTAEELPAIFRNFTE